MHAGAGRAHYASVEVRVLHLGYLKLNQSVAPGFEKFLIFGHGKSSFFAKFNILQTF
jgi:hypothetical protein